MVENWNSANKDIFYGKASDLIGDDREHVGVSALALHLVRAAIVHLNTRMVQIVLAEPKWRKKLTDAGWRPVGTLLVPSEPVRQVRARHEQTARPRTGAGH
ncbi:Tn3 family transposase [Nonomuraea sp. NPDC050153]|uniref:Tn3 family transposase n=1 Tax=Nonomuraea sp. NPDC050153 TaxID=3364359 RepID=UPI00379FBDCE